MQSELLTTFEEQVAELEGRLPGLKGKSRRGKLVAQLESLTEFLELIDLIGDKRAQPAAHHEIMAASND